MELALNPAIANRPAKRDGGPNMAFDLTTAIEAIAGGSLTAWGIVATRKDKATELLISRVSTLETRMDAAQDEIAELRSDKLRLESEKYALMQQVADLTVERTRFQRNENEFRAVIADLELRLTAKNVELENVTQRLEAIKVAMDKGDINRSILWQIDHPGETPAP
jgi:chromosome segregation ATPase